nr:immunoglobulin light chain junction region [Macaca mulatta]
CQQVYSHPYSF